MELGNMPARGRRKAFTIVEAVVVTVLMSFVAIAILRACIASLKSARLNRHHLDKIGKSARFASHRKPLEDTMQSIICRFRPAGACQSPQFPRTLDLQAQGRFAIGFYQQAADSANRRDEAIKAKAVQNQQA